ncbi:hypothetical protein FS837_000013 [Tulasnella sp. UAMH 9824]|nr:hypothetical protein FS837_000013 [Tulasnella sp. UAMH 9824]
MGESRTELLQWLNDLLQTNYTKVEQCGTGGAYCQIMDSIYGDVPMSRVKMNAKHEYEFLANFKILQNVFKAKKVEKPIPVEKLVKCKMQDNLEFLQWIRRFWDANASGEPYDAAARRKGGGAEPPATIAPVAPRSTGLSVKSAATGAAGRRTPLGGAARSGSSTGGAAPGAVQKLQAELAQSKQDIEALELERNFYFNKLRDIEILVQQHLDALEAEGQTPDATLKGIQEILYKTEDGFEPPGEEDQEETF